MRTSAIAKVLISGAATVSLAIAGGAMAQGQGKGNGNGGGNAGKAHSAAPANSGNGKGGGKANGGNDNPGKARASGSAGNGGGNGNGNAQRSAPPQDRGNGNAGNGGGNGRLIRAAERDNGNGKNQGNGWNGNAPRGNGQGNSRDLPRNVRSVDRVGYVFANNDRLIRDRGLLDGCPPGLAKKRNGCTPPGLDRRDDYRYDNAGWWGLPGLGDGRYRYYGGNLVRLSDAGSILGYYPLLGGALSVGNVWPSWYDPDPLPPYYQEYYSLGPSYRYADNVVYRTDPGNSAITSIAALLTGSNFQVGQPMPSGYDVYNVPYGYRDQYYDDDDAYYRYSDGYVYEVDPTSQLITAAIELLS